MDGRKLANDVLNGLPRAKTEKPRPDGTAHTRFGDSYSPAFFADVELDDFRQARTPPAGIASGQLSGHFTHS